MSGVDPNNVEAEALSALGYLASRYGVAMVLQIIDAPETIVEELSQFVANLVSGILMVIEKDAARAALQAGFAAANATADAAEDAKFGKP